jgi:1-acyl-sn-glycerol-3-phosphate acyltransferase
MSRTALLFKKRLGPLFATQFFGAFNDNVLKNAIVILFAFTAASADEENARVNLAAGVFILPFFLFSATAGQIADKLDKARLIRMVKAFEIAIMAVATVGFFTKSTPTLLASLFLMGLHSTIFGPVKYSILPQQLPESELVLGNGLIEMGTFVAILLGTITGGVAVASGAHGPLIVSSVLLVVAALGYLTSRRIPAAPPTDPTLKLRLNIAAETWHTVRLLRANRTVLLSILGVSWFWFYGALFVSELPGFCKETLGGNERGVTLLLTVFSVGVGIGSVLCERLARGKIELGLVPFGSMGLTLFALDLYFASHGAAGLAAGGALALSTTLAGARVLVDLALIGVFGGFFIVPLYALIQSRSHPKERSRILAGNNVLNALFMVLAALLAVVLRKVGLRVEDLFLVTAALNALVAVYIYTLIPEFLMRFLVFLLVHTMYRIDERGLENIPEEGAAVVVCNHVSFVDALLLAAASRRPLRFVMDHRIFKIPVLSFFFRTGHAIPIAPAKENPALMEKAFGDVAAALEAGEIVCIFPEGKITKTGEMNPFRPGIERIIHRTPVPVVPVALSGLWGSFFSREGGHAMRRPFRRFWSKVRVQAAPAWPAERVTASGLEACVHELRGAAR